MGPSVAYKQLSERTVRFGETKGCVAWLDQVYNAVEMRENIDVPEGRSKQMKQTLQQG